MALDKVVKITNRGMISIPASLRKKFSLKDGDRVLVIEDEGTLRIIPVLKIEKIRKMSKTTSEELIKIIEESRKEELELRIIDEKEKQNLS